MKEHVLDIPCTRTLEPEILAYLGDLGVNCHGPAGPAPAPAPAPSAPALVPAPAPPVPAQAPVPVRRAAAPRASVVSARPAGRQFRAGRRLEPVRTCLRMLANLTRDLSLRLGAHPVLKGLRFLPALVAWILGLAVGGLLAWIVLVLLWALLTCVVWPLIKAALALLVLAVLVRCAL